jgi:pimeloyl-ACP methyl ester carboxylesterase
MAERYQKALPQSPVFLLSSDIGHWPQLEAPQEVIAAFNQFQHNFTRAQ